jgi:hypothetical protein
MSRSRRIALVAAPALVLAILSASAALTAVRQLAAPPPTVVQFGYVRSLVATGGVYRMRFDPALWLSGETANRAAVEDGVIPPGETVPNDYYIRNETKKQLTYTVPRNAHVTVLTMEFLAGLRSTRIAVSELAAIVKGRNPKGRKLYGAGTLGYWVRIAGDRVTRLDQQYQP